MLGGMLDAVKGCLKEEIRMDIVSNNMANSSVIGFKKTRISFQDMLGTALSGTNTSGAGKGSNSGDALALKMDLSQGDTRFTGNSLDFAINGDGFFKVETAEGIRYTRKGNFALDTTRTLLTQEGDKVLGVGGAIKIPEGEFSVAGDGRITVDGNEVGRIAIVNFENFDKFVMEGRCLFFNEGGEPEAPRPAQTNVQQGFVELSNVNAAEEMVQMIHSLRAFESYQKAIQVLDGLNNKIINDVAKLR